MASALQPQCLGGPGNHRKSRETCEVLTRRWDFIGIYRDLWEFIGIYESHHLKSEQRMRIYSELSTKNGDLRVERVMQMRSGRGYVDSKPQDGKLCKSGIASRAFKIW